MSRAPCFGTHTLELLAAIQHVLYIFCHDLVHVLQLVIEDFEIALCS